MWCYCYRVPGHKAAFVGKSFLVVDKLNRNYAYGSNVVNIIADATIPDVPGSFGWDDEVQTAATVSC